MNGFERRAAFIKEKIMNTTLSMLKTWDPKQIRITDIAKMAKVSQVTIYNYFGSKDALLREAIKVYMDHSINVYLEYMNGTYSTKEKIERIILQDKESFHALSHDSLKFIMEDEELSNYAEKENNTKVIPQLLQLLEDGKKNGEISNKISTKTFLIYIDMCTKYSKEALDLPNENPNFIDEFLHIFFYGICGKP